MANRWLLITATLAVALLAAGCGSHGSAGSAGSSARPSPVASDHGIAAQRLAAEIPGCAPHLVDAAAAAGLGLPRAAQLLADAASAATCTLQGRTAVLASYPSRQTESAGASAAYAITAYFAAGRGWLALPLDLSEPVGQQSVVQDVALALDGQILVGSKAPRASAPGG